MYLGRVSEKQLRIAKREFKKHKKWYEQEKRKKFVTPDWKKEWLSMYPHPLEHFLKKWVGDIEKLKNELAEKEPECLILKDLESIIPKKLTPEKYLVFVNVLRDIINISDVSGNRGYVNAIKRYERRLERKDPKKLLEMRKVQLCHVASTYQDPNERWTHNGKLMQTMKDAEVLWIANGENKYSLISKEEFEKKNKDGEKSIFAYYRKWRHQNK